MKPLQQHGIIVKPSPIHGLGVFAQVRIPAQAIIEECYCLKVPYETTLLRDYLFKLTEAECVIPLGAGAIYNHSSVSNASYEFDYSRTVMVVKARREILPGEEIVINYGRTWFSSRHLQVKQGYFFFALKQWASRSPLLRFSMVLCLLFMVFHSV